MSTYLLIYSLCDMDFVNKAYYSTAECPPFNHSLWPLLMGIVSKNEVTIV